MYVFNRIGIFICTKFLKKHERISPVGLKPVILDAVFDEVDVFVTRENTTTIVFKAFPDEHIFNSRLNSHLPN